MANIALDAGKVVLKDGKASCTCCGGCECGLMPPLADYCYEITIGQDPFGQPPPYILKFYFVDVIDGRPVIGWAVDYGSYQGAPYLSYWEQGIPPNWLPNGNPFSQSGTNFPSFYYTEWTGYGVVWGGSDLDLCTGLVAQGLCKVSC